ncbi:MAG: hypothetical protein ABIJ09_12820 [Pseudomonadota bacterium]
MFALASVLAICALAQVDSRIHEDHGSVGVHAGYRYVPNPFFDESTNARDPVVSSYVGAPGVGLRFDYYPMAVVPLVIDLDWTAERHELASGGTIGLNIVDIGISLGFKPDVDWWLHPYALGGVDQVNIMIADSILSSQQPSNSFWSTFGLHAAIGAVAPVLVPDWRWLGAMVEARYTFAPMTQRGRSFWLLGASVMVGLQLQFDVAGPGRAGMGPF